jgi:hypothetical protein
VSGNYHDWAICKRLQEPSTCDSRHFRVSHRVLREFTVFRDPNKRWLVAEAHGLRGGVFDSRDEAVRFALWKADSDLAPVDVERLQPAEIVGLGFDRDYRVLPQPRGIVG